MCVCLCVCVCVCVCLCLRVCVCVCVHVSVAEQADSHEPVSGGNAAARFHGDASWSTAATDALSGESPHLHSHTYCTNGLMEH